MLTRRRSLSTIVLALSLSLVVRADDAQLVEPAVPQNVIVLQTGRVILGEVVERPGGYLVNNTIGQMVIPFTQVRLTAIDLPDAYRKLKGSITVPTAGAHVSLAQWCFENRLYDSAREQVKAALTLEPQRKEARTLLKQIERTSFGDDFDATIPAPPKTRDGFEKADAEAVDGLSTSVTQDFVRKVQPLLMNKCGNVRCHGTAGGNDLRLVPVRLGMSGYRSVTSQNLHTILRYIDRKQPRAERVAGGSRRNTRRRRIDLERPANRRSTGRTPILGHPRSHSNKRHSTRPRRPLAHLRRPMTRPPARSVTARSACRRTPRPLRSGRLQSPDARPRLSQLSVVSCQWSVVSCPWHRR